MPQGIYGQRDDYERRELTVCPLVIRAESVNEDQRSVEAVLSTQRQTAVFDFSTYRIIDEVLIADGAEFGRQIPLLESHHRYSTRDVLGSVRGITREGDQISGTLVFADGDDNAERAWNMVRQGHLTDVSVGYRVTEYTDIPAGQTQRINGREYTAGKRMLRVSTRWQIRETSLVPIGADEAAKIRAESGLPNPFEGGNPMPPELRKYLESLGLRSDATDEQAQAFYDSLSAEQQARADTAAVGGNAAHPAAQPQQTPVNGNRSEPGSGNNGSGDGSDESQRQNHPDTDTIRQEAAQQERQRISALRELAGDDVPNDMLQRAIDDGWSQDRAGREFLSAIRSNRQPPVNGDFGIHVRDHNRDCNERTLAAGFAMRVSNDPLQCEFGPDFSRRQPRLTEQDADRGSRYVDMSLLDVCREVCRITGARDPLTGGEPYGIDGYIRAATSTTTLSNIFSTSIHARLLMGYAEAVDTTDWCSEEDVSNFQTQERASLGKTASLEVVPSGGTANHATIGDSKEEYKVHRYGKQFVVDEIDIRNDNLNGIQEMPFEMGMAARRLRPDIVYSLLLANASMSDGTALFHNDHSNLDSNAFNKANLEAGITAMYQQTQNSVRLNIRPRYLIVPGDLEWDARELLTSGEIIIAGDTDTVRGNRNVLRDLNLELRVEGRIDANGVTNPLDETAYTGSASNWFLAGASNQKTVRVGYLAGTGRRPTMRRFTLDRGQWGIGWDIKHVIGAKALDFRALYQGNS